MEKKRMIVEMKNFKKNYENPFLKDAIKEISNNIVKKYKMANNQSENAVLHAIDPKTGEIMGHTTFIRQMKVDKEQFIKIYINRFSTLSNLNKQAIKVFDYIIHKLKPNQDKFEFLLEECKKKTGYRSHTPIYIGMKLLLETEIIARGPLESLYFINPMVCFNGNRITFADSYFKVPSKQEEAIANQEMKTYLNERNIQSEEDNHIKSLQEEIKILKNQLNQNNKKQLTLEEAIENEKR